MIWFYKLFSNEFKEVGFTAQLLKFDNEVSKELIKIIQDEDLIYVFKGLYDHLLNPVEQMIHTVKK